MRKKFPDVPKKERKDTGNSVGKAAKPATTKAPNSDAPKKAVVPAKK